MSHKLEKADLLKAIQEQLIANVHSNDGYFEVIDFASDATITDRNGKVYFADRDDSVTLPTQPVQEFLLSGHVRVRPYQPKAVHNSAERVNVNYEVSFVSETGGLDFTPLLRNQYHLTTLAVGDSLSSQELAAIAQFILSKNIQIISLQNVTPQSSLMTMTFSVRFYQWIKSLLTISKTGNKLMRSILKQVLKKR